MDALDNSSHASDQSGAQSGELSTASAGPIQSKGRRPKTAIVAGCLIGLLFMTCLGLAGGLLAAVLVTAVENQDEWLALGDAFMRAMAAKEVDQAYSLFAEEVQRDLSVSDLAAFVDGPLYALYEGYVGLEMEGFNVNYVYPEGSTVEVVGLVNYREGQPGSFEFVLLQEGETWKLWAFNVEAPPEKFNAYTDIQP